MAVNITGKEFRIGKIFSDDFVFTIPPYQRPYSWTNEHAGELLDDLLIFMNENGHRDVRELNPYFLGSIVLIKGDGPDSEVVDGQQRLTTLTILFAALRALAPASSKDDLTKFLYEKGNRYEGTPNRYRLKARKRDAQFFRQNIQDEDGLLNLEEMSETGLPDAQRNMRRNAILYLTRLRALSEAEQDRLAQFLITRCFLIAVSTPDLASAYRIFSILNDRGMDLSHTDILKAEIIGAISEAQRDDYTEKWEDLEDELGREPFQDVFSHIRMIYLKAKPRENLLDGFRKQVNPTGNPIKFIDDILYPYANAYADIINADYRSQQDAEALNSLFRWLNRIDNVDWIPPAVLFYAKNDNKHEELIRFFTDLERLAAGMMIYRANINDRMNRYGNLLAAIENGEDLYNEESPLQLTSSDKQKICMRLDGDIYHIRNVPRYVLLRLDSLLSEGTARYMYSVISVEHVLPQTPAEESEWLKWFPDQAVREQQTHRLGNLVLLSRRKNSRAKNFEFDVKKSRYFSTHDGVSPFVLTMQVINESEWTNDVIERRQKELLNLLVEHWRLS